jgi:EmrB/QacA subfamily drug resistance transporter
VAAAVPDSDRIQGARENRRWVALVVLSVGQLMVALDGTVVNVALPTIQRELNFSHASLAWIVNGYLITFGGLLLLAGRLGDLIGRKRLFLIGVAAFSIFSVLCGASQSAGMLIAARFLQGGSAALMASMVLGMLSPMFPISKERTRALSIFAAVTLCGASLGLPLGGALIELSWHWIFLINFPIGVATFIMSARFLEPHTGLGIRAGADVFGALFVTTAPMLTVYALIGTATVGWGSVQTILLFAAAIAAAILFIVSESRAKTPLIPLRIFRNRNLTVATVIRFVYPMGAFGTNFIGPQFLQYVLGYSPLRTGLAFLPNSVAIGLISLVAVPYLATRISPKVTILAGLTVMIAALLQFSLIPVHGSYAGRILPALICTGFGFGLVFTPTVGITLSNIASEHSGLASGLANVSLQMGGSIGVALLASVSASRTTHLLARGSTAPEALAGGYHFGFQVAAACSTIALIIAAVLLRPGRSGTGTDSRTHHKVVPAGGVKRSSLTRDSETVHQNHDSVQLVLVVSHPAHAR